MITSLLLCQVVCEKAWYHRYNVLTILGMLLFMWGFVLACYAAIMWGLIGEVVWPWE